MAGLVPAIHVLGTARKDVDARHKAGHDELRGRRRQNLDKNPRISLSFRPFGAKSPPRPQPPHPWRLAVGRYRAAMRPLRSEEHTSELQSQFHLVCRLLLEKK